MIAEVLDKYVEGWNASLGFLLMTGFIGFLAITGFGWKGAWAVLLPLVAGWWLTDDFREPSILDSILAEGGGWWVEVHYVTWGVSVAAPWLGFLVHRTLQLDSPARVADRPTV